MNPGFYICDFCGDDHVDAKEVGSLGFRPQRFYCSSCATAAVEIKELQAANQELLAALKWAQTILKALDFQDAAISNAIQNVESGVRS